ncbi:hypothetical protein ACFYVL_03205 [Streptomyces sp. NPDC004111]|uniref:hypothetical protein n=1 Tax=Streptomyces sp. NPDC004111 TaxID=3364690 RepID=UPI0036A57151
MAYLLLFACFTVSAVVSTLAARVGRRGQACDRNIGYSVPAQVRTDPELRRQANTLIAHWCTGAAILSLAPLAPLGMIIASDGTADISTWGLLAFAAYGFVVVVVGGYPFEKIKHLAPSDAR